jgi:hypothetical protein
MVSKRVLIVVLVLLLAAPLVPLVVQAQGVSSFPVPPGRLAAGDETGLFTMQADGSALAYLIEDGDPNCWLRDGKWSPDGARLIYTRICGGQSPTDWHATGRTASVWLYETASGTSEELVPNDGSYQDYAGAWHPDGDRVMIYSNRVLDRYNLYLVDLADGQATQYTDYESDMGRVAWDPTGRYLLYNRYIADFNSVRWEVRALDTATGNEMPVTVGLTPNFSPDGQWLAYATDGSEADVFIMPAACIYDNAPCDPATDAQNVTFTPDINEREPVWSPDQTQLVYLRDTDPSPSANTWDVFRQDLRTGLLQNLTNTPDIKERHSAWEPVSDATPVPVADVLPVVVRVSSASNVNLRAESNTESDVVGIVPSGQLLIVQGATANGSWYRVTLPEDGATSWIFANLTVPVTGDPATLPVVEE